MRRKYFAVELASGKLHAKILSASFSIEGNWRSGAPLWSGYRYQKVCVSVCVCTMFQAQCLNKNRKIRQFWHCWDICLFFILFY